jgi:uncharacterized protein (TIGR00297 family)
MINQSPPYIIITALALASFLLRKLSFTAAAVAVIVGVCIFWGAGYNGLEMLGVFFVLGVLATNWHKHAKRTLPPLTDISQRDAWQVLANGGVAAVSGLLALHYPSFKIMIAGSLAAATADTLSSELGMVYGRRFYHVITFKPDKKGLDGVVSLEGTLAGIIGAMIIGIISGSLWVAVVAGVVGSLIDSVLGATLERRNILGNNMVNLACTITGAMIALLLSP